MNNKQEIRYEIKKLRLDMDKKLYQAYSDVICNTVLSLDEYKFAKTVLAYCPISNEVDTSVILEDCIANKKLALPKTSTKDKKFDPYYVENITDLKEQAFSILEPDGNCKIADADSIDLVIVPLVAFDRYGTRIGYGGGYYDRFLSKANNAVKIGIAFSFQEVEQIEWESHDIKLDIIITENKLLFSR